MNENASVKLYNAANIDTLRLPESEIGHLLKDYWVPLMQEGVSGFIKNVQVELRAIAIDTLVLPITINHGTVENSYVCSPYNHYITYAREELHMLKNVALEQSLGLLLNLVSIVLKWGKIDRIVMVNNWLLSTNLYPPISAEAIKAITSCLKSNFSGYTIAFRSINTHLSYDLFQALQTAGYQMLGSRQIYVFDPKATLPPKTREHLRRDFKLIAREGYEVVDASKITQTDIPRIVELYNLLYLEKYSYNNPQFTEKFIALALSRNILQIHGLKKQERIDGVTGFYCIHGVMTTPLFGYDTSLPQTVGLYRMLSAQLVLAATQGNLTENQSSGAASFKQFRGAIESIEYTAIFTQHLPIYRQLVWRLLTVLVNRIAVPVIKKYRL